MSGPPELERAQLFTLTAAPGFCLGPSASLDDLRVRRRKRNEALKDYRANAPLRRLSFTPAVLPNGADAPDVVQLHLEHRLIRRLLARFTSQGFQGRLSRCCVFAGPGAQPRAREVTEANHLRELLENQRARIAKQAAEPEDAQLSLPGISDKERAQRRADRRHWAARLAAMEK